MTRFNGTRKDYAISLGLATAGRGRMSLAAHEAVNKAIAEGMSFSDHGSAIVKGETPKGPTVSKADSAYNEYAAAFERFPHDQMFFYVNAKGKRVTLNGRAVCRECGYSLVGHTCTDTAPTVLTGDGWQSVRPVGE